MSTTKTIPSANAASGGLVRPGLTSAPLPRLEFDVRTAFDFLTSICTRCTDLAEILPPDRAWLEAAQSSTAATIGEPGCSEFFTEIGRALVDRPQVRTARELVALVSSLSDDELLVTMLGELLADPDLGDLTRRVLERQAGAWRDLAVALEAHKGQALLPPSADELIRQARATLTTWLPYYEQVEEHVGVMLAQDAAIYADQDLSSDPLGLVERITNGIRLVPSTRIRRVVLVPNYFERPYNSLSLVGECQVILYPISDASLGTEDRLTPPPGTVRLYRALGDEHRLRILRLLSERSLYLTEIANELGLSKPTASHHLALLRSAGLVIVTAQGNLTYYNLRRDRAEQAGSQLQDYLRP